MMLILDTVANKLRTHVKQAKPRLVWGLLLGRVDTVGTSAILQVMHLRNISRFPSTLIKVDIAPVARYMGKEREDGHKIIGYYYSSTGQEPFLEGTDTLPFPRNYYVLRLISTETQFRWEAERITKFPRIQLPEPLQQGTLRQIEKLLPPSNNTMSELQDNVALHSDRMKVPAAAQVSRQRRIFDYVNHCYRCNNLVDSASDHRCERCGWFKCSRCNACGCDYGR